jgi:hypothetical protein
MRRDVQPAKSLLFCVREAGRGDVGRVAKDVIEGALRRTVEEVGLDSAQEVSLLDT